MKKAYITWGAIIAAIILVIAFVRFQAAAADYKSVAKCLTEEGVKFYGAYWCPHCAEQKSLFGDAVKYLPYVECASPTNPNQQNEVCTEAGVDSYPTWVFPDGERATGTFPPEELARRAGCE